MPRTFREISFIQDRDNKANAWTCDSTITFEDDGTAYRRINSGETDDFIDVPVTGTAIDYERRLLEAKRHISEADDISRKAAKAS